MKPLFALVVLVGCGGRAPAPAKPAPIDPAALAGQLDADMKRLAEIAHRLRGRCNELVAELDPHIAAMREHAVEVERAQRDPELGKQLKIEVEAYAEQHRGLSDQIAQDLAHSYLACKSDERIKNLVDRIPTPK